MKLVLFSDLHLDAPFAWLGASPQAARARRQALRDTLRRIAAIAATEQADALLCAGDLYEHERATDDTGEFLRATFAEISPLPVFLAPGNHDWFGPRSLYHRVAWTPNVHVFREAMLQPVELVDGVTLWGAGHRAPANTDGFLEGFQVARGGINLALFHGSLQNALPSMEDGKVPHAPFRFEQIAQAGLKHAFVGHYHRPVQQPFLTYPGNPEPLTFGEDGERGAVIATLDAHGGVVGETRRVDVTPVHDLDLDVTGCASRQEVRDRLAARLAGLDGVARVTVGGELPTHVELRLADLQSVPHGLAGLVVRFAALRSAYDLTAIAAEPTVRGQFVRGVQASALPPDDQRRVIITGLRALEGRDEAGGGLTMRFEKVAAYAFGPLVNATLDLAPGMNVVFGPNEAGKSTWHAALYAGLCGRKRGQGRPSPQDQQFRERHHPWDRAKWDVGATVQLADGRRIELRHDLEGNVNCRATDADLGRDVTADLKLINDGAPDGAKLLGLDRRTFLATACVRQAELLAVRDDPKLLQEHLQRAADTGGVDATAAAALERIDMFRREHVGVDQANAVKPLRKAVEAVAAAEAALTAARLSHTRHLQLAEQAEALGDAALAATARHQAVRAGLAEQDAHAARTRATRARELAAAFPTGAPAGAADADTLAQEVAAALLAWQEAPVVPALTGESAADLRAALAALPESPAGDLAPAPDVTTAADAYRAAAARLSAHDDARPVAAAAPRTGGASATELHDLARDLAAPLPEVDAALQQRYADAKQRADAPDGGVPVAGRGPWLKVAAGVLVLLGLVLCVPGLLLFGGLLVLLGAGLFAWATWGGANADAATRSTAQAAALRELQVAGDALGQQRHALDLAQQRRTEAVVRATGWGVPTDPAELERLAAALRTAEMAATQAAQWAARRVALNQELATATAILATALAERIETVDRDPWTAFEAYAAACATRSDVARAASRRVDLGERLRTREAQEQTAADLTQRRQAAADRLRDVAQRCGVAGDAEAALVAGLEAWRTAAASTLQAHDAALGAWAELQALLDGGTVADLETAADQVTLVAAQQRAGLTADVLAAAALNADPRAQLEALRTAETDARAIHAEAVGQLNAARAAVLSVAEAEERLAAAQAELARVRELDRVLDLTRQYLGSAQDQVHRDIAPQLAAAVRPRLARITGGRYVDVRVDPASLAVRVYTPSGDERVADRLSQGTAEQVYLLLRVALAEHLTKAPEVCPLVLDDVTVQSDPERTVAILDVLHEISRERQVILFTQEDEVRAWAEQHLTEPRDRLVPMAERQPVAA